MAENEEVIEKDETADLEAILGDKFEEINQEPSEDAKGEKVADEEKPSTEEKDSGQTDETKEAETDVSASAIEPPVSWPADDKALWNELPPKMQEIVARRESERDKFLTQKSNEFGQQLASYKDIDHALAPVEQLLKREGINKAQAVKELVAYYQHYESNTPSYILQVAQSKGIDLLKLAQGQLDPRQIESQNQAQELNRIRQELNDWKRQQEDATTQELTNQVDKFASESGHEHFSSVRIHMGKLIAAGEATDLQTAYEMAVWANPTTRSLELKKQENERVKNSSEKVTKAKKAAGPKLSTKEFSSGKSTNASNEDDFLREEFDRIQSA